MQTQGSRLVFNIKNHNLSCIICMQDSMLSTFKSYPTTVKVRHHYFPLTDQKAEGRELKPLDNLLGPVSERAKVFSLYTSTGLCASKGLICEYLQNLQNSKCPRSGMKSSTQKVARDEVMGNNCRNEIICTKNKGNYIQVMDRNINQLHCMHIYQNITPFAVNQLNFCCQFYLNNSGKLNFKTKLINTML